MDENLIKIVKNEILGDLPDPFIFDDGHRVKTPADWEKRRKEIYKTAVELQYGTMPPAPEYFEVETLYNCDFTPTGRWRSIKIHAGTKENPVSFLMKIYLPVSLDHCPVVIDGDMCFPYHTKENFVNNFIDNGVALVLFDRTEIVHDVKHEERENGGALYKTYPEYTFGAIGAWAWGYSRCLDALEKLGFDFPIVAFTGHSRGGKTAMLAGVLDERADIVCPNETNQGSCSCYRNYLSIICEDGEERRSERLSDILTNYPFWFGPEMMKYKDCPEKLPFDSHFLKALVAPRILCVDEAASDAWTNPVGSWQTTMAAKEVYDFLGAGDNLYWYFRPGYHYHKSEDVERLINIIHHVEKGEEINKDNFFKTPFPKQELMFKWKKPE